MRKQRILALGALFVGFMGIAMVGRNFGISYVAVELVGCGACIGAAFAIFVKSLYSPTAPAAPANTN
jgi:hypothetical protein